jgi:hypothetical protein
VGLPPPVLGAVGGNDWPKLIGCGPNDDVSNCSGGDRTPCRGDGLPPNHHLKFCAESKKMKILKDLIKSKIWFSM